MTTRPPGSRWAITLHVETGIPDDGGVYQFDEGGIPYAFFVPRPVLDSLPADRIVPLDPEPAPVPEWPDGLLAKVDPNTFVRIPNGWVGCLTGMVYLSSHLDEAWRSGYVTLTLNGEPWEPPVPEPVEPEWKPGDVRVDADGKSWQSIHGLPESFRVTRPDGNTWLATRAEMEATGPMTPVIRNGRKWEES